MGRFIVTGAAGFIGSHLTDRLLSEGHEVIGIDYRETENIARHENYTFYLQDVRDVNLDLIPTPDGVFHQAATGSIARAQKWPMDTLSNNVHVFNPLAVWCSENKVPLVFASSSSVYGSSEHLPDTEGRLGLPMNPYAASKLCNEIVAAGLSKSHGLKFIALRYFNVFGPRQAMNSEYAAVIPKWIKAFKDHKQGEANSTHIEFYGDGTQKRDFTSVHDVVEANILAMEYLKVGRSDIFNVGSGYPKTLYGVYTALSEIFGYEVPVLFKEPRPERKASHASLDKIKKIGYAPKRTFRDNLREAVEWYRQKSQSLVSESSAGHSMSSLNLNLKYPPTIGSPFSSSGTTKTLREDGTTSPSAP